MAWTSKLSYLRAPLAPLILALGLLSAQAKANLAVPSVEHVVVTPNAFDREHILDDVDGRISSEFKIPSTLKKRVGFWFDIYTRYTSNQYVIHHADYPWVIFDVVDVEPILSGPGHKWTKFHRAEKEVKLRKKKILLLLQKLSRIKNKNKIKGELAVISEIMNQVPGHRPRVFRLAAQNIRTQLGQKDFIETGLINASKYFPEMEKVFETRGLPVDLTRLPLVESSFNEEAVSKVGASGIWQLMPYTGRQFLFVNGVIDERNSPIKATEAAAKLFALNHKLLRSWPLTVTAYNHGPGGLKKAMKKLKTDDVSVLIEKYRGGNFGFATSNFYCEFLAALHAERYQKEAFGNLPIARPLSVKTVPLPRSFRLRTLSNLLGLSLDDLQFYNPELRADDVRGYTYLPKGFKLLLPPSSTQALEELQIQKNKKNSKKTARVTVSANQKSSPGN
jgi:membrane-bound lytic murein transglycosylase D